MPNRTLLASTRWPSLVHQRLAGAIDGMTEPYTLESLYPPKEIIQDDGTVVEYREILPHQLKVHEKCSPSGRKPERGKTYYTLHSGGVGSGKSIGMAVELLSLIRKYPGIQIWSIAPYDYYFDEFIWPTIREILPDESSLIENINIKQRVYYFRNGSQWTFKAFDDPGKVKGFSCNVLHFCEASELGGNDNQKGRSIYNMLMQRMRTPNPRFPRLVYIEQNPAGHNWVWGVFVRDSPMRDDPKVTWILKPEDDPMGLGICFSEWERTGLDGSVYYTIASGSTSNTKLQSGFISAMLDNYQMDDGLRRRMVMGSFDPINLLVFGEPYFNNKRNLVDVQKVIEYWGLDEADEPFPNCVKDQWKLFVGIDCAGASSPWAIEFFVETPGGDPMDPHPHLLGFDEIYVKGLVWEEIAELIKEKTEGWADVEYWIDPISSKQASGPSLETILVEFSHMGIDCNVPKFYRTQTAWMHIHSLLHGDKTLPHPYLERDGDYDVKTGEYEIGAPSLMFLKSEHLKEVPQDGKGRNNPHGWQQYALSIEMGLYRLDGRKQREQKAFEEGLSPLGPEKVIARDDHGITAMYFCTLGWRPPQKRTRGQNKALSDRGKEPLYPGESNRRRRGK